MQCCCRSRKQKIDLDVAQTGPTSAGKTSMVRELAAQTGHHCVRINNHEGTDLQVRHIPMACNKLHKLGARMLL